MPRFAIGFCSVFDSELKIEIHEAPTWREASLKHSYACWDALEQVPEEIEVARAYAFDCNHGFDYVEIPK